MKHIHISLERLRYLLRYDEVTGEFYWRNPQTRSLRSGCIAGRIANSGYRGIMVDCVRYQAHRLAWFWCTGEWPENEIDHKNGKRSDNRKSNLRLATKSQNQQNIPGARRHNTHGFLGVTYYGDRWRANIKLNNKTYYIGTYDTPEEAHKAYLSAKKNLHKYQPVLRISS